MSRFFSFLFGITWSVLATAQLTGVSIEPVITHDASIDPSLDGYTTYRVYADVTSSTDFVSAVFGDSANPLVLGCTGTIYHSTGVNFNYATEVNPLFFPTFPAAEFDSWFTIGAEDANGGVNVQNTAATMEPALELFNAGEGFTINDPIGASWWNGFPCAAGESVEDCAAGSLAFGGADNRVLLAQITATGDVYGIFNLQVFPNGIQSEAQITTAATFSTNPADVFGCTNEEALNYDDAATKDDLSCTFPCSIELVLDNVVAFGCGSNGFGLIQVSATGVQGADYYFLDSIPQGAIEEPTDFVHQNFGNFVTEAGGTYTVIVVDAAGCMASLEVDVPNNCIPGCMDFWACNYEPNANFDDGSCFFAEEFYDCDGNSLCESSQSLSSLTIEVTQDVLDSLDLYRLYVDLPPINNWYVSAVWSDQSVSPANQLRCTTQFYASEGVFNSSYNATWSAQGISTAFVAVFPELAYDSFATIGLSGPASESSTPGSVDPSFSGFPESTTDFINFFTSNGIQELELSNATWYILPSNYQTGLADENGRCLIGQICTSGSLQGQVLVQLLQSDGATSTIFNQGELARYAFNGAGQFSGSSAEVGVGSDGFSTLASIPICGCEDPQASNFIPWVELGTDTCEYFCANDEDEDGICDDVDDCIGQYDACGVCNGLGEVYACGCFSIPVGECDCEGNTTDAIGVCGGSCTLDNDGNGVCDNEEVYGCSYALAENYSTAVTRDDGSCLFPCEGVVNINVFDWDGDYAVTVTDFLMMLSVYGDVDVDLDGIWDSGDDCVDTSACNYASDPSEPCAYIDILGICGGGCEADEDNDGICDDVDTCVGDLDECGVCNGPGPTEIVIEEIVITYDSVFLPFDNEWFVFPVDADTTFSYTCAPFFGDCGDPVSYQGYDYATVLIGDQCWFAENLRNENYENGDAIPAGLSDSEWTSTTSGATAVYGEGSSDCSTYTPDGDACDEAWSLNEYGRLYNWYAVDDARGLCPSGWHVPTDGEWMTMEMALGMSDSEANSAGWRGTDQGTQMKTTYGWNGGGNGTNSSGFSGLPGGYRYYGNGDFSNAGSSGYWWSSSPDGSSAWSRILYSYLESVDRNDGNTRSGFSVRCVRDAE